MSEWTILFLDNAQFPCGCRLELRHDGPTNRLVRIIYCPTHTATTNAVSTQVLPSREIRSNA
jgi:hypothetical protein